MGEELLILYQNLSENLETLANWQAWDCQPESQLAIAVVLEDLTTLVEECEQYLIDQPRPAHYSFTQQLSKLEFDSFQARCATIIEEVAIIVPSAAIISQRRTRYRHGFPLI